MKKFAKASDIKVGVIGYGGAFNMGRYHFSEMQQAGMVPSAVAEPDPLRREAAQVDYPGIQTYASATEMLKNSGVDLVTIITPHNTHAKLAIQCLKAGRHVVCEKPLAIKTEEVDAMIAAAKKSGVVISTYHNRHWDGWITNAVKVVKSGVIGDVVRVEARLGSHGKPGDWWRTSKSISGGIMYDWGVHLLEYTMQIITAPIVEVSGFAKTGFWADQTAWKKDTNEDEGFLTVRYGSGQWSSLRITSLDSNPNPDWVEITGTKGTFAFDFSYWKLITNEDGVMVTRKGAHPAAESWRYYQNIADHLTKGEKLVITPEWARRLIHILDLADQSAKKGTSLKAKYK